MIYILLSRTVKKTTIKCLGSAKKKNSKMKYDANELICPVKQKQAHIQRRDLRGWGQEQTENLGCADAKYYKCTINNAVLVQHRELYSVSRGKS